MRALLLALAISLGACGTAQSPSPPAPTVVTAPLAEPSRETPLDPNTARRAHYGEPPPGSLLAPGGDPRGLADRITSAMPALWRCDPDSPTTRYFEVAVEVASNGEVESATMTGEAPAGVSACITGVIRTWQFESRPERSTLRFPLVVHGD